MPFNLGGPELIIVLVIVLIVFGAGKLPSVMRDVGKGVTEFKKASKEEEAVTTASDAHPVSAAPTTMSSTAPAATTNGVNGTASARTAEPAPRA